MKYKIIILLAVVALSANINVLASEVTGNLSTGLSNGVQGTVVVNPTASPVAGTYSSVQTVSLMATGASNIHYTTDGFTPTCATGSTYSGAINVSSSLTIKAIACYPSSNTSTVVSFAYGINIPTPTPSGGGGGGGGGGGTPAPLFSQGNSNGDSVVDILDFNTLISNWGQTGSGNTADFNGDGVVDILDFNALMANWS